MDSRTPQAKGTGSGDIPVEHCQGQGPRKGTQEAGGKVLGLADAFVRTIRHFWPDLTQHLAALPDSRYQPFVVYDKKFLAWWGLLLFCFKLGSRRQLDYDLRDAGLQVLANVNRLAATEQETLPVHKSLEHFLGHVGWQALATLRTQCLRRLLRMKALDPCRLLGNFTVAIDGSNFLLFRKPHCPKCLAHYCGNSPVYLHPVLEAKLVDPSGLALSMATEFIENPTIHTSRHRACLADYHKRKQDCELTAFRRLAANLKKAFPQTRLLITADALFACASAIQICEDHNWPYIFTFKQGRTPALWDDFQGLLKLVPENTLRLTLPNGVRQLYRWVNDISYLDRSKRTHLIHAILLRETSPTHSTTFAWITSLPVNAHNVVAIATQGGRLRQNIENQGFNLQKNSGLNLEHAYSFDQNNIKAFYHLLQIAHIFLQMLELGSLLRRLAYLHQATPVGLFGSLKNIARRLLDAFRYFRIPEDAFDSRAAASVHISLDTS